MSRDMQIGLLLAVGFLALVGGVLYYRIEHPDELEQLLGNGSQAQATAPVSTGEGTSTHESDAGKLASNQPGNTAPPPANQPPPFDTTAPINTNTATPAASSGNTGSGNTGSNVVLAGGNGASSTSTPPANSAPPPLNAPPPMDLSALDKKSTDTKPAASSDDSKKTETATNSRASLPVDTPPNPAASSSAAPPLAAPALALDLLAKSPPAADSKKSEEKKPEEKKIEEKKPIDVVVKPDNTAPPVMSPPSMTPPAVTTPLQDNNKPAPTSGAPDLNKSQELPQPPVVTPPTSGILFDDKPKNTAPGNTTPPANNNAPLLSTPPANNSSPPPAAASTTGANTLSDRPPTTDADGFRTYPPKVTLGKPMPESEAALREQRWADSAGKPAPIIPSSTESRSSTSSPSDTGVTRGDRKVVRDTYIPTERAQRGETFTSLSQRLYGDTNYAVALAAFNKEEGFVKMDQPEPNEWVAKPNREILDQRFPQLIRRLTPSNISNLKNNASLTNNTAGNAAASTAASTNHSTYRVGKGEQLFEVAKKTLGDGYRWSEIYALNKDLLRDSTELRPDMVLKIPSEGKK